MIKSITHYSTVNVNNKKACCMENTENSHNILLLMILHVEDNAKSKAGAMTDHGQGIPMRQGGGRPGWMVPKGMPLRNSLRS